MVSVAVGASVLIRVGVLVDRSGVFVVVGVKGLGVTISVGVAVVVGVKGLGVAMIVGVAVLVDRSGVFVVVGVKGLGVAISVGVAVLVAEIGVLTGVGARLQSVEIVLLSIVTAPVRAKARPTRLALVLRVMLASASTLPTKVVSVPIVAELPTCQNTLQPDAPLIRSTEALLAVVSVLPVWKTKTASGSPWASSVSAPVICATVLGKQ